MKHTVLKNTKNENCHKKEKKIAVSFPGIGYTCEKPLLYYSGKLVSSHGYEVIPVSYGNFPSGIKGNRKKMEEVFFSAFHQAEEMLRKIEWQNYPEILFISKSIGTVVAAAYKEKYQIPARSISFTPLTETFQYAKGDGIMFHGTNDPWEEDSEKIQELCKKINQPLYLLEDGNHSLETQDAIKDIENLRWIMEKVQSYLI